MSPTSDPGAAGAEDGSSTTLPPGPTPGRMRRLVPFLGSLQGYIGLVLIFVIGVATKGGQFSSVDNITNAVGYFAPRGILAIGMTFVIITAGIDLSVGSLLAVGGTTAALLLRDHSLSPLIIVPISMGVCAVFGFVNGAGTAWLKVQPFVMTLAMLTIARGIVREASNNTSVGTTLIDANGNVTPASQAFEKLATPGNNILEGVNLPLIGTGGLYFPVLAFLVTAVIFQVILAKTTFGRHVYAVGGNPTAARLSGVKVTMVIIAVYTIAGMLAGIAGPINAAYNASADPQAGMGYELDAIAAVVIGGASLAGGRGSVTGTVVGSLILTLLDNVLGLNNVSANYQMIIKGIIVVVAVVIQRPDLFAGLSQRVKRSKKGAPE